MKTVQLTFETNTGLFEHIIELAWAYGTHPLDTFFGGLDKETRYTFYNCDWKKLSFCTQDNCPGHQLETIKETLRGKFDV